MPVTSMSSASPMSRRPGGVPWMGSMCSWLMGPRSSMGSPMTFMIRPRVAGPTGTVMGAPVSTTLRPRAKPSVAPREMVRTRLSPRCWATSRVMGVSTGRKISIFSASSSETVLLLSMDSYWAWRSAMMTSCWRMAPARPSESGASSSASSFLSWSALRELDSLRTSRTVSRILRASPPATYSASFSLRKAMRSSHSRIILGRRDAVLTRSASGSYCSRMTLTVKALRISGTLSTSSNSTSTTAPMT
mmetsp:Transcript_6804/g.12175  ORF Transcript_6804/g.12175 Transcript_6804/m.12175 type:complete len:247 (+) Transcript_6804:65-805(+)